MHVWSEKYRAEQVYKNAESNRFSTVELYVQMVFDEFAGMFGEFVVRCDRCSCGIM